MNGEVNESNSTKTTERHLSAHVRPGKTGQAGSFQEPCVGVSNHWRATGRRPKPVHH